MVAGQQRRYGTTTKSGNGVATMASRKASATPVEEHMVPLLTDERIATRGPSNGRRDSEREPLLVGSGSRKRRDGDFLAAGSSRRDNSKLVTTLLALSYMIGSGVLNAPQVFEKCGVVPATALYIITAIATWTGLIVLIKAAEMAFPRGYTRVDTNGSGGSVEVLEGGGVDGDGGGSEDIEFAPLAAKLLGTYGGVAVDAAIVVTNFCDILGFTLLVGTLTETLLEEWFGDAASDAWWSSFSVVTPVMVLLFVFPPSLIRHFSNLRWLAVLCFGAIVAVALLVIVAGPIYAYEDLAEPNHDPALDAAVVWWDLAGSVAKLGSIVFSLSFSVAALHAYTSLSPRTARAWKTVASWGIGVGLLICYTTGLSGYLYFRDAVDGDILENFSGPVASVFKVIVIVHVALLTPSEVVILRHSTFALCRKDVMSAKFPPVAWVTFALLAAVVGVIVGLNAVGIAQGDLFGYILDITGGVTVSILSFVLPGLIYLGATSDEGLVFASGSGRLRHSGYRRACKALVVFGVVVMIMVPIGVVVDILEG